MRYWSETNSFFCLFLIGHRWDYTKNKKKKTNSRYAQKETKVEQKCWAINREKQTTATMQNEDMKTLLWSSIGKDQEKADELQEQEKRLLEKYLK